jgi:hypothetical protein
MVWWLHWKLTEYSNTNSNPFSPIQGAHICMIAVLAVINLMYWMTFSCRQFWHMLNSSIGCVKYLCDVGRSSKAECWNMCIICWMKLKGSVWNEAVLRNGDRSSCWRTEASFFILIDITQHILYHNLELQADKIKLPIFSHLWKVFAWSYGFGCLKWKIVILHFLGLKNLAVSEE